MLGLFGTYGKNTKAEKGVHVVAAQSANHKKEIAVNGVSVEATTDGRLAIYCMIGDERAVHAVTTLTLAEVLAWLPELNERAKRHAAAIGRRDAKEEGRQRELKTTPARSVAPGSGVA